MGRSVSSGGAWTIDPHTRALYTPHTIAFLLLGGSQDGPVLSGRSGDSPPVACTAARLPRERSDVDPNCCRPGRPDILQPPLPPAAPPRRPHASGQPRVCQHQARHQGHRPCLPGCVSWYRCLERNRSWLLPTPAVGSHAAVVPSSAPSHRCCCPVPALHLPSHRTPIRPPAAACRVLDGAGPLDLHGAPPPRRVAPHPRHHGLLPALPHIPALPECGRRAPADAGAGAAAGAAGAAGAGA